MPNIERRIPVSIIRWTFTMLVVLTIAAAAQARPRLQTIQRRGYLTCGVYPHVAGFAEVDDHGRYVGFDVDICRALSAAIFGVPDKVRYIEISTVAEFLHSNDIDVVSRRLTWELGRERPLGLLFGPVVFYDGQGFLVDRKIGATTVRQLSGVRMCVAGGTTFESKVTRYFGTNGLTLVKVPLESADNFKDVGEALAAGGCDAYTADVTELGAIRSKMARSADFEILSEMISKEPLAQLVRQDDAQFFDILRWTVSALVDAEELGIDSRNVDEMRNSSDIAIQLFLGTIPKNGKSLGLSEDWAHSIIKGVGNYGEIFDKNLGRESPIQLDRGLNRLWTSGGLMYAPPMR